MLAQGHWVCNDCSDNIKVKESTSLTPEIMASVRNVPSGESVYIKPV